MAFVFRLAPAGSTFTYADDRWEWSPEVRQNPRTSPGPFTTHPHDRLVMAQQPRRSFELRRRPRTMSVAPTKPYAPGKIASSNTKYGTREVIVLRRSALRRHPAQRWHPRLLHRRDLTRFTASTGPTGRRSTDHNPAGLFVPDPVHAKLVATRSLMMSPISWVGTHPIRSRKAC